MPFCRMCGSEIIEGSRFCPQCGASINPVITSESEVFDAPDDTTPSIQPEASSSSTSASAPEKKPFYTRWWFLAIVFVALLAILVGIGAVAYRSSIENQPVTETLASYGDFEATTVDGSDDDFVDIPCAGSPCIIDFEYEGVYHDYGYGYSYTGGVCAVWAIDKEGNRLNLMEHRVGPFSSTLTNWGVYDKATALYVDAEGDWSATFRPISTMGYAENGESFTGSNVVAIDADVIHEVSFTHNGSSNFVVGGVGTRSAKEIVNTVGLFKGTIQWNEPKAFFVVLADGDWTIEWN